MTQSTAPLRIGTRGSPLALVQARTVRARLATALEVDQAAIELVIIRTSGDAIQDRPLAEVGGKGLFTKEIEEALLDGRIDLAVHSAKDMPTVLPAGLILTACLEREDPRDVFITPQGRFARRAAAGRDSGHHLAAPAGYRQTRASRSTHGPAAWQRRDAAAQARRPAKCDATILALAGMKRLGLTQHATKIMSVEEFLPAVAQGAIGIETREDDARTRAVLARIDHADTSTAIACERAFLAVLDGSCKTPIGGHADISGDTISFSGLLAHPDGKPSCEHQAHGSRADAIEIGAEAGRFIKREAPRGLIG